MYRTVNGTPDSARAVDTGRRAESGEALASGLPVSAVGTLYIYIYIYIIIRTCICTRECVYLHTRALTYTNCALHIRRA